MGMSGPGVTPWFTALLTTLAGPAATAPAAPEVPATIPALVWPLPADPEAAARAAGLPMLGREMLAVHYHAHLDVIVGDRSVVVPAGIGIDQARGVLSALHTHTPDGIVHIESAVDIPYTLGQFFTEWGQSLTPRQVGAFRLPPGWVLRVFQDGTDVSVAPDRLRFRQHDEIAVWVGPVDERPVVPSFYLFPQGL